jgi:hypothetical protein
MHGPAKAARGDTRLLNHKGGSIMRSAVKTIPGIGLLGALALGPTLALRAAPDDKLDADKIAAASGAKATTTPDGVVRIAWARTDVKVQVDGMPLKPFAGLGSWAAFSAAPHGAMVMGDTVVFEDEVTPAMDAAFANGLEVTGLHNHFFHEEPQVFFMHIGGHGDPEKLAAGVKAVWDAMKKVRADKPEPGTRFAGETPKDGGVAADPIEKILGVKPEAQDGVVKATIGRDIEMHGVKAGKSMGVTTWAAFSGSDELAAIDGDFAMTADEVQAVLHALRKADIHEGFKAALDAQKEAGHAH